MADQRQAAGRERDGFLWREAGQQEAAMVAAQHAGRASGAGGLLHLAQLPPVAS
jgi:hypothetical protein